MIAYSYIRMSTPGQLKGDSLRRQIEASRRYASEHQLVLDESLDLQDLGVSAFTGDNAIQGALSRFMAAINSGKVAPGSTLLVESLDRLSRQRVGAAMGLFLSIVERGVTIVTLADGNVYRPGSSDPMPLIQSLLIMSRAHEESQIKSQRLAAAWETKRTKIASKKLTGQCPRWLSLSGDSAMFIIQDERAAIVRDIFEWASNGMGHYAIAKRLNTMGVAPFGRSAGWQESYVEKIIKNRAVIGEFQPHKRVEGTRVPVGEPIRDYFPPVIAEDLFYAVQAMRRDRRALPGRKGENYSNLFGQIAKCGHCGATMRMLNKGKPPKGFRYLRCSNAVVSSGCYAKAWRYDAFEAAFLTFCGEADVAAAEMVAAQNAAAARNRESRVADEERLRLALTRRDRTFALLDQTSDEAYVLTKLEECNAEIRDLNARLAAVAVKHGEATSGIPTRDLLGRVLDVKRGDFDLRNRVALRLKEIVRSLKIYPTGFSGGSIDSPFGASDWLNGPVTRAGAEYPAFAVEFVGGLRRFVVSGRDKSGLMFNEIIEAPAVGDPRLFRPSGTEIDTALAA